MYELLLVDDEEISRQSLATYFPWENEGFHICGEAENGKEALEFIKKNVVHVVLTDISMPVMDGIKLAEELQSCEMPPCIVFLSAYDDFQYAQKAVNLKVRFYVLKPSKFKEIKEVFTTIRQELDTKFEIEKPVEFADEEDIVINKVRKYIHKEYKEGSLKELSKQLYLNPSYLSQFIKLKTGENFVDLLYKARMKQASLFLKDPEIKIYNISEMVGYSNPNNFARAFRAYCNQSPKEYRISQKRKGL